MRTINNIHSISADAQKSIKAFFYDFSKFMEENFSATPDQLMLDWNCVGATAQFHSRNNYFEFQLWECSEGYLDIPDHDCYSISIQHDNRGNGSNNRAMARRSSQGQRFPSPRRHVCNASQPSRPNPGCASSCITL